MKADVVDGVANFVLGFTIAVACAPAGVVAASSGVVAGGVGAAKLLTAVFEALSRNGIESKSQINRIRKRVLKTFEASRSERSHFDQKALYLGDIALSEQLKGCVISRDVLVQSVFDAKGYPSAATEYVVGELTRASKHELDKLEASQIKWFRMYLETVLNEAFATLVEDKKFFESLLPMLSFEIARNIGMLGSDIASLDAKIGYIKSSIFDLKSHLDSTALRIADEIDAKLIASLERQERTREKDERGYRARIPYVLNDDQKARVRVDASSENVASRISQLLQDVRRWSGAVKFLDMSKPRSVKEIYVELDAYVAPIRLHFSDNEKQNRSPLKSLLQSSNSHLVILGGPGAGKTTSMKQICQSLLVDEDMGSISGYSFPFVMRLRDIDPNSVGPDFLQSHILASLGIEVDCFAEGNSQAGTLASRSVFTAAMRILRPVIIVDGFDECRDQEMKQMVLRSFRDACSDLDVEDSALLVLTCRTGEFNYAVAQCEMYEISPLTRAQIQEFSQKWLGKEGTRNFLDQIRKSPFMDATIKPITLAHLCVIYQRNGSVPDKPKSVYYKIVRLLVADWDEQRSVVRKSAFSAFSEDRKIDFLAALSYFLTAERKATVFNPEMLRQAYAHIHKYFDLPIDEMNAVVEEIEAQTGLFIQSGVDKFEFVHKSIQEYLAALHIVRMPNIPSERKTISHLGSEMAIAVAISSVPSMYFSALVFGVLATKEVGLEFLDAFVSRLLQEKPEFHYDQSVIVGVVLLFSLWSTNGRPVREGKLVKVSRKLRGTALEDFFALIEAIRLDNDTKIFFKYYERTNQTANRLALFKRRENSMSNFRIPPLLLLHEDLIERLS